MLAALSIILGKVLKIAVGDTIRISFESLPVILSSLFLGPYFGMATGLVADLVGCLIVGYAVNPFITAGCVLMGLLPFIFRKVFKGKFGVFPSVMLSHMIASVGVKTAGLIFCYGGGVSLVFIRLATYLVISAVEAYICFVLLPRLKRGITL